MWRQPLSARSFVPLTGVSSFLCLEGFARARNAIGFFWVWIGPQGGAAVRSVLRLRVPANAHLIPSHNSLLAQFIGAGTEHNQVFPVHTRYAKKTSSKV